MPSRTNFTKGCTDGSVAVAWVRFTPCGRAAPQEFPAKVALVIKAVALSTQRGLLPPYPNLLWHAIGCEATQVSSIAEVAGDLTIAIAEVAGDLTTVNAWSA